MLYVKYYKTNIKFLEQRLQVIKILDIIIVSDIGLSDGNGKKFKLYLHLLYRNLRPKFIKSDIKTKYFTGFSTLKTK